MADALDFAGTGRFQLVRRIASDGVGVAYKAFDRERNAVVALKTLRAFGADALRRFKHEFRALQELQHPNLVGLGELIEEEGRFFLSMELVRGGPFTTETRPILSLKWFNQFPNWLNHSSLSQ